MKNTDKNLPSENLFFLRRLFWLTGLYCLPPPPRPLPPWPQGHYLVTNPIPDRLFSLYRFINP